MSERKCRDGFVCKSIYRVYVYFFFFSSLLNFGMYLFLLFDIFDGCMIIRNTVMMKRVSKEKKLLWFDIFDGYMVIRNTFMLKKGSRETGLL